MTFKTEQIRTTSKSEQRCISNEQLFQKMSEVISLREKVAQAELAISLLGPPRDQNGHEASR
jgi:hypothetical protein